MQEKMNCWDELSIGGQGLSKESAIDKAITRGRKLERLFEVALYLKSRGELPMNLVSEVEELENG